MKEIVIAFLSVFVMVFITKSGNSQVCSIPEPVKEEINFINVSEDLTEKDFLRINSILFAMHDSLETLKNCECYSNNISNLFYSTESLKRLIAYRLIGVANDTSFNSTMIDRISSDESSFLKTWSSIALMNNGSAQGSDALFKLFSSFPDGLPVEILIKTYITYDTIAVKKTCWKFVNSDNKNEQIMAIQCLSNMGTDDKLQSILVQFLNEWDIDTKGWVISSMGTQKMGNLKPLLEKYAKNDLLRNVIIDALKNSPSELDRQYAKRLSRKKN